MAPSPTRVRFDVRKYGVERGVDASSWPAWTGVVPDGEAHVLDFVEVLIVHRGSATVHAAGRGMPVGSPCVVVTRPGVERRVAVTEPLSVDLVVFPERGLHRLGVPSAVSGLASGVAVVTPVDVADLAAVGRLLRRELEAGCDDAPPMLDALLTQFVVRLRRAWPAGAHREPPRLLARFERLLERDFRHEHRVAAYAARLGVSADHLSAVARAHTGASAKAMIEGRLMREASAALTAPGRRVADVAAELGYDEPSHFTRAFRRWTGVSPLRLRSRH
jgi:AraC family transcriptional regulator, transcriptional activator of pobA